MERIVMPVLESVLRKLMESISSKMVDQTTDSALNNVKNMKEFEVSLKTLQKNLKLLSAQASDVEEEIKNAELSGRKKRKREVEEWLEDVRSIEGEVVKLGSEVDSQGFIMRLMDGGNAALLNEQVDKLVEQRKNFGELLLDVCETREVALLTDGLVGKAFEENLERILELLETGQVSSIGVYGMGGVGKSTLAKHIHNRLLQQSRGRVIWVTVSQEYTVRSLQGKIAHFLGVNLLDEEDDEIRAGRLHTALSEMNNSVLILDDVWENIDMLKVGCRVSVECCRLIVTTRSLKVCHQIRCQKVIRVEKLPEEEALKLFNETLGEGIELSPQVEEIVKSMVKLCDGLPLGIITVAGSMRGETAFRAWKHALAELKEHVVGQDGVGDAEVYKVLKYSFDRLNRNHQIRSNEFNTFQLCFLYCSLYPEDFEIVREYLVRMFIYEGLMDERKNRRAQVEQGHFILDKLENVCLLESCVNYEGYESVKMHDLVRGMALKIGEGKYMVRAREESLKEIPDEQEWTKGLEKVSLMRSGIERIGEGISPDCPNLSTLLLCLNVKFACIPDSFFSKIQGLCTLNLSRTGIRKLPDSISDMKSLKALLLEGCSKLVEVPYLGKLKALRELNLSHTAIEEVPQGVEELINLKFLSMNARRLKMLPRELLLKLGHLQHVNFPLDIQVAMEGIENLKQLQEFHGGVKNVKDFNSFITSRVVDTYRIGVGLHKEEEEEVFGYSYNNNELILFGCNLQDAKVLGQDVVYLTINECEGVSMCFVDDLSRLNNPTSLKRLSIKYCGGIEWILRSEEGLASHISKTLERIQLVRLEDLKGVIQKGEIRASPQPVFSSLRNLYIYRCNKVRKLGLPVLGVPIIEEISIYGCGEIEEIFEDEGGGGGSITLPKLRRLWLLELPRLKRVCKATMICNSINIISILKCPRLMKLPVHVDVPPPPTLGDIWVEREWWETLEWDNPNLPQLLQPLVNKS